MARSPRIEFPGALYHITCRGNEKQAIFRDTRDREGFLGRLADEVSGHRWLCHAFCLMDNHYHLLLETPLVNLAHGMQRLNSAYAQWFNLRHERVGHLFQGRYHSVIVERESYLLELSRYIVLNPVRAGIVQAVEHWPWSSYRATAGLHDPPAFLTLEWLWSQFAAEPRVAQEAYRRFVAAGLDARPWDKLVDRRWLGSKGFRRRMQKLSRSRRVSEPGVRYTATAA
jgi:REP element-mobilizing transposase RayT